MVAITEGMEDTIMATPFTITIITPSIIATTVIMTMDTAMAMDMDMVMVTGDMDTAEVLQLELDMEADMEADMEEDMEEDMEDGKHQDCKFSIQSRSYL